MGDKLQAADRQSWRREVTSVGTGNKLGSCLVSVAHWVSEAPHLIKSPSTVGEGLQVCPLFSLPWSGVTSSVHGGGVSPVGQRQTLRPVFTEPPLLDIWMAVLPGVGSAPQPAGQVLSPPHRWREAEAQSTYVTLPGSHRQQMVKGRC